MNAPIGSTGNPETASTLDRRRCRFCGGTSLRHSRLRVSDLPWVLVLHWPVRCRRCSKRQYLFLTEAQRVMAASPAQSSEPRTEDTWQTFTADDSPALRNDERDDERDDQHRGSDRGER